MTYFYTATIGFAIGIFLRSLWVFPYSTALWLLLLSGALILVWRRKREVFAAPYVLAASLFLLFAGLGIFRFEFSAATLADTSLHKQVGESVELIGVVDREPEQRASSLHVYVNTEETTVLALTDRYADVGYGDRVRVAGTLREPEAFETDLGRTFNYPGYLAARGVTHTISFAEVTVIGEGEGNPVVSALLSFKQVLIASFSRVIPEPQAGLGAGLLLGVKQALGESLETAFRVTGIIHIVVLSGYNVMIVAEAIMRLLAVLFSLRTRVVIGLAAITGFAVMVGLTATVVRASIMAGMVLVARATGRTYAVMRALVLAGFIMLFIDPYLLVFDPGFQLSFLATLGLLLVAPFIETWLSFAPSKLQIREFITATVSTQLFVLPLLLYLIGEFSVVAVPVNVLVLPMVPIAMGLVFVTGMLGFLHVSLAAVLGALATLSLSYIVLIAEWFAALPFASFVVPPFPFWLAMLAYGALGYWLYWLSTRRDEPTKFLAGWTIVEEEEEENESGDELRSPPPDTPIFFR